MTRIIQEQISRIEKEEAITILFAVESGSRAWGFASTDSDYDIRFVYAHPEDWYISIASRRETMEYPVDEHLLDWSGWDIRKALKLFAKSNPPLLEWIRSPIVYRDIGNLRSTLRALERTYFSPRACIHHYLHMAAGNYRDYLQGDTVRIKKYFYVLRPLLACEWIKDNGTPPPMEFASLTASQIPDGRLKDAVARLTSRKIAGEELSVEPQITLINEYIEDRIAYYTDYTKTIPRAQPEIELLDDVLRRQIKSL